MTTALAAEQRLPVATYGQLLFNGDRMDQKTFHALYLRTPDGFKAELVGGVVYLASPVSFRHGRPHAALCLWLGSYQGVTPGTDALTNTTNLLDEDSEPQLATPEHAAFVARLEAKAARARSKKKPPAPETP